MKKTLLRVLCCLTAWLLFSSLAANEETKTERGLSSQPLSPFAGAAASGTDWILLQGETKPVLKPLTSIGARATSLALFPVCAAGDILYNVHRHDAVGVKKSCLGLLASPSALLSPDLVSHHFLPQHKEPNLIIPYGKLYSAHAFEVFPGTVEDVQEIVLEARNQEKTIAVIGAGMSQGRQALPNRDWNVVINTSRLNHVVVDPVHQTARVGAGATWADVQRVANQHGLAVLVMQASNVFSIGGSLSANCHGWDHKTGSLRHAVLSIALVDASGSVQLLGPEDELFHIVMGGYGGFGVIVEAELRLTPNVELLEEGAIIAPSDYLAYFKTYVQTREEIDMHLYRLSLEPGKLFKEGVAVNWTRLNNEPKVANLVEEPQKGSRLDRIKLHAVRRLVSARHVAWNVEKKNALKAKRATRNASMRPPIKAVFNGSQLDAEWLQEYFVKGEELVPFLQFLAQTLQQYKVPVFNASVRFVKHDPKGMLSYSPDGDRFAVVLFFNQKLNRQAIDKTKKWVKEVIDYLIAHEGTYYLPYQHFATLDQFRACYPRWETVSQKKRLFDPDGLFDNGLYADYILPTTESPAVFRQVFHGQREQVSAFLNNIFLQLNEEKFFSVVDSILANPGLSDDAVYEELLHKISKAKLNKLSLIHAQLKAVDTLKNDLAMQVESLMGTDKALNGYVEIGYTGRLVRPLKKKLPLNGPVYVINEGEYFSDYLEERGSRPYDHFIALNDYAPISDIPSESVDLVACYIGLHHIPSHKIHPFLASIKSILRPGGSFILMDHDARTENLQHLIDVVHSIYNASFAIPMEENRREVRHFRPLSHWISLMESHGFELYPKGPFVRKGDPTLNSLIRFCKPLESKNAIVSHLSQDKSYLRPQLQTYMSGPEWQNVRAAQQYAAFVEKTPSYHYPYFREIGGFWKVFGQSWSAARNGHSFTEVAFSDYTLMNLFVGTTMTLEYGAKGVLSAPLALLAPKTSKDPDGMTAPEKQRLESLKNYAASIEQTPFYEYPYFSDIKSYWKSYGSYVSTNRKSKGLLATLFSGENAKNIVKGTGMSLEYTAKGIVAAPLALVYGRTSLKEAETIQLLVADKEDRVERLDSRIKVLQAFPDHLKHIEVPRYMAFKEIVIKIANARTVDFVNIAGQSKIQLDIQTLKSNLPDIVGCRKLYDIPMPTDPDQRCFAYEVEVDHLGEVVRTFEENGANILLIHDF